MYYGNNDYRDYLAHYGVKGMKWGKHLYDSVVNGVYRYGDIPGLKTNGVVTRLANRYDKLTKGRLSSIAIARKTASDLRNTSMASATRAANIYTNRARSARLVNKGIAPGGKSEMASRYGQRSSSFTPSYSVYHSPAMQASNERKAYVLNNKDKVAARMDARVDKTFEVRFAKSIVRAKNAVTNVFSKGKKVASFAGSTINKGRKKISSLFSRSKTTSKRPHSRKKKYSYGSASVYKRKRLRR